MGVTLSLPDVCEEAGHPEPFHRSGERPACEAAASRLPTDHGEQDGLCGATLSLVRKDWTDGGTTCFPEAPSVRISEGFNIGCWRLSLEHVGSLLEAAVPLCGARATKGRRAWSPRSDGRISVPAAASRPPLTG